MVEQNKFMELRQLMNSSITFNVKRACHNTDVLCQRARLPHKGKLMGLIIQPYEEVRL